MLWEKVSMFGITGTTPSALGGFPREGDEFIMQMILQAGYNFDEVKRINRVQVSMQVLFMFDILTASGNTIAPEILSPRPRGEAWSNMRWPSKRPTPSDMTLEECNAHHMPKLVLKLRRWPICPTTHRIWKWHWNSNTLTLHCTNEDGVSEDVFVAGKKPN